MLYLYRKHYSMKQLILIFISSLFCLMPYSCSMVETNSFGKKEDKSVKGIKSMLPDRICVFAPSELYALSSVTKSGTLPPDIYISSDNLDF